MMSSPALLVLSTIESLYSIDEKWTFLLEPKIKKHSSDLLALREQLQYAARLWLVDYQLSYEDYNNRLLIKTRKTKARYPATISKAKVKEEVTRRLQAALTQLHELPVKRDYILLRTQAPVISQALDVCHKYFSDPIPYLQSDSALHAKNLQLKLAGMFVEYIAS